MRVEEGKFYRTRDGRRVGPLRKNGLGREHNQFWPLTDGTEFWRGHTDDYADPGKSYGSMYGGKGDGGDIVAEWTDGPVRTVTRKEIVPGTYGHIEVDDTNGAVQPEGVSLWFPRNRRWKAGELRAAAATLTEIADALEDK